MKSFALLKKILLLLLVCSFISYLLYQNVNLKDSAIQRDVKNPNSAQNTLQKMTGQIVVTPETPNPWLQNTFEFIPENGEVQFLQAKEGWEIQPGVLTLIRNMKLSVLLLVQLFLFLGVLITTKRWQLLLQAGEIPCSFWNAFRLTSIGLFFNSGLPGATGGDLVKAVYIARRTEAHRERAVITVILDRILGLIGLLILASILVCFRFKEFQTIALILFAALGGLALGSMLAFNGWLRDFIRLEHWITRLPFGENLKRIDQAFLHFRNTKKILFGGILLSILNHLVSIAGCFVIGRSLGDPFSFDRYLILLAVGNIIISIPIFPVPGGLGVREIVWGTLFQQNGSSYNMGVVLATTFFFLVTLLYSAGGFFLLTREGKEIRRLKQLPEKNV